MLTLALTASTLSLAHGQSAVELLPGFDAERLSKIELSDSNTDQPIPIAELSAEDRSELAKLVYRMNRLTGKSLEPLLNSNGGTGTATSLEQRNVGDAFRLKGELLSSTLVPVPGDLAEMLELTAFSRSQVRLSDQSVVDVVSIALPKPAAPADRLSGIAVKIGHGDPVACVAGRLAWSPASPGTPRDAVLAAAGIDLSRLPEIASLERKPLGKNDSDVFFSLIGIAHKAASASDENSRAMRATPIAVQPVDLLKEPKELTAQWVTLQVETVRWTKVAVTSGIRQKQLGGEFYYQIDAIGDLGNVQLRIELPDGEAVEMNNRYPVTLVSAELPEFLKSTSGDASLVPAGEPVVATTSVSVQVDGFFYRLWSYESDLMKARGGKQFAPLIVAGRLLDRRPQSSDPIGVSMIGWIAAGGVLLAIAATLLFTWFTRRGDRKARRQRMSGELEES